MNDFDDDVSAALHADAGRAPEPPAAWQPRPGHGHAVPERRRRPLLLASAAVIVIGVVGVGVVITRDDHDDGITTPIDTTKPTAIEVIPPTTPATVANTFPPAGTATENFLVVGADANACVDPGSPWAGAADPDRVGTRSDTIMIIRVDPVAHRAAVLSFPRDLWVNIPGGGKQRINTAYVPFDYSLLAQTIADNFGISVDHYIQVDFCSFKRIIDAFGGVAVPFSAPVRDRNVGLDIAAGCHVFEGDEALAYVRSRHLEVQSTDGTWQQDPTSDFGRIARQQDFVRRVLTTALDEGLFDPAVAGALIDSLQRDIVTEAGFGIDDVLRLAGTLRDIDPTTIQLYRIDATGTTVSGNAVLQPITDTPDMKAVLAIFRGDADIDTSATGGPAPTAPSINGQDPIVPDASQTC